MIKIDEELCKGCDICIEFCPKHVYVKSYKENKKSVYLPFPENESECKKCHLCELMCPDQAIAIGDEDISVDNIDTSKVSKEGC